MLVHACISLKQSSLYFDILKILDEFTRSVIEHIDQLKAVDTERLQKRTQNSHSMFCTTRYE